MNLIAISVNTMSSREIAELVEKQHSNIKISAERLAEKGVIGTLASQEFAHNGNTYTEYLLNKRDSLILVAQNCPEFTARIVDRWQELEAQAVAGGFKLPRNMAEALRLAADQAEQIEAQQATIALQAPKVEALERIAQAEGAMCITNAAKALQCQPKRLFAHMQSTRWIYRRAGGTGFVGYQDKIQQGLLDHKVTTVERSDGTSKMVEQVLVTPKGLTKLAEVVVGVASNA